MATRRAKPIIVNGELRWVAADDAGGERKRDVAPIDGISSSASSSSLLSTSSSRANRNSSNNNSNRSSNSSRLSFLTRLLSNLLSTIRSHPFITLAVVSTVVGIWVLVPDTPSRVKLGGAAFCLFAIVFMFTCGISREQRQPGELSAYSIANPNGERMAGQLRADQFDREMRGGAGALNSGGGGGAAGPAARGGGGGGWAVAGQGARLGGPPANVADADEDADLQEALRRSTLEQ